MYALGRKFLWLAYPIGILVIILLYVSSILPLGTVTAQETTPAPGIVTLTSTPLEMPVTYDSFTNKLYDGSYDPNLWQPSNLGTTQIIQQDGVLMLSNTVPSAPEDSGVLLKLNNWSAPVFGFFEARVQISQQRSRGANGVVALTVYIDEKPNNAAPTINELGWVQIGLNYLSLGATVWIGQSGEPLPPKTIWAAYDTWYTLRIEFNSGTNSFDFFWDDQPIMEISINDLVSRLPETSSLQLLPAIQLWHDSDTALTAYLDYVRISP